MDHQGRPTGVRRTLALTRDERSVTLAADALKRAATSWEGRPGMAAHEERAFDIDTTAELLTRVQHLSETMTDIVNDDALWNSLRTSSRPLPSAQLALIRALHTPALTDLLVLAGYRNPPPPPVDELVDEALAALDRAMAMSAEHVDPERAVAEARLLFGTLAIRARAQVKHRPIESSEPIGAIAIAEQLAAGARRLIPIVAGVAAGAFVELHMPGTGAGFVVGSVVQRVAELGVEWAAQMLIGTLEADVAQRPPGDLEAFESHHDNYVLAHTIALNELLHELSRAEHGTAERVRLVRETRRHLRRLEDLAEDYGLPDVLAGEAATLHRLIDGTETLLLGHGQDAERFLEWAGAEGLQVQSLLLELVDSRDGPYS